MNVLKSSHEFAFDPGAQASGAVLPLVGCDLTVDACGGHARVRLTQRFENPSDLPLTVTYKLPLPADAAVSDFTFHVGERVMRGKVKSRSEARQDYERALVEGRSAALLEQEKTNLFTQEIGNIPPRASVIVEIDVDQPLAWLSEGYWEWRFPLTTAPRYLGDHVPKAAAERLALQLTQGELGVRASLALNVRDNVVPGRSPESPSHPLSCSLGAQGFAVQLGSGNRAELDRDVVVRWPTAAMEPGLALDVARASGPLGANTFGLLTLVPPAPEARVEAVGRDLTLLLDTSGSMQGQPLDQAKRIACAMIDSLGDADLLELIEFSNQARAFRAAPQQATPRLKQEAMAWVRSLHAQGGTEMVSGVERAMRELRPGSQRQIILVTDGLVGFEEDIVSAVLARLPLTARLHCVGVGSAVNRSLVAPIARAGRGVEVVVGLGEDAERAARRLLAGTVKPLLVDVVLEGPALKSVMPSRLPDVFEGCPLRAAVELAPEGGVVRVRARMNGRAFVREIRIDPIEPGMGSASIPKLFARELIEDLEMKISSGGARSVIEQEIERVAVAFQISSRLTSWIAETVERTVDPRDPSRKVVQPNALAHGLSAEGLGLREATGTYATQGAMADALMDDAEEAYPARLSEMTRSRSAPMPSMPKKVAAPAPAMAPPPPPPLPPADEFGRTAFQPPPGMGMGSAPPGMGSPPGFAPPPQGFPQQPQYPQPQYGQQPPSRAPEPPPPPAPGRPMPPASMGVPRNVPPPAMRPQGPPPPREEKADLARGRAKESESEKRKSEAPRSPTGRAQAPSPGFGQARIAFVSGSVVTVELLFSQLPPGAMLVHADVVATLVLADGRELALRVWPEQSSREGALMPTYVYRLALIAPLALDGAPIVGVRLMIAGVVLEAR